MFAITFVCSPNSILKRNKSFLLKLALKHYNYLINPKFSSFFSVPNADDGDDDHQLDPHQNAEGYEYEKLYGLLAIPSAGRVFAVIYWIIKKTGIGKSNYDSVCVRVKFRKRKLNSRMSLVENEENEENVEMEGMEQEEEVVQNEMQQNDSVNNDNDNIGASTLRDGKVYKNVKKD